MLIPIRCFTCNKVIGHKWNPYKEKVAEYNKKGIENARNKALNEVGLTKYCCRRMLLSHVDVIDQLLLYKRDFYAQAAQD